MGLKDRNAVVTGGSRGLGLGLVEALVAHGARVTVVARNIDALESVRARLGVATISADVTDETAAHRILAEVRPDILALNAGAKPRMGRLDQLRWADFTTTWETDVKAGLQVVSVLDDPKYAEGFAFGLKGDTGITMLEGAAA
ncbi:SDR family NAD(P)-dependent oxidoreductase [Bradyrhizobium sediminis]|uniref:SDR family NAD(P)-dependent oxidoreductase n=1 Tax=Bradyrhizobium sediminis TaxID=2840469 RepID=A0A975RMZ1_9BRAD|nr:SDR family NAD(P)-dependent oxidoreductase [Bradyrhizobium sediminis]QWG14157.1 SDR family NAD(P)-dependent oxidoreductase [Bradyrhizobium sediminis]